MSKKKKRRKVTFVTVIGWFDSQKKCNVKVTTVTLDFRSEVNGMRDFQRLVRVIELPLVSTTKHEPLFK
jgi:hypothetical protein